MVRYRGDNIPTIADYSHWNEDAALVWYEENKYDMQHWDEPIEEDWYEDQRYYEDEIPEAKCWELYRHQSGTQGRQYLFGPNGDVIAVGVNDECTTCWTELACDWTPPGYTVTADTMWVYSEMVTAAGRMRLVDTGSTYYFPVYQRVATT